MLIWFKKFLIISLIFGCLSVAFGLVRNESNQKINIHKMLSVLSLKNSAVKKFLKLGQSYIVVNVTSEKNIKVCAYYFQISNVGRNVVRNRCVEIHRVLK
jgi:hypothetical protein